MSRNILVNTKYNKKDPEKGVKNTEVNITHSCYTTIVSLTVKNYCNIYCKVSNGVNVKLTAKYLPYYCNT